MSRAPGSTHHFRGFFALALCCAASALSPAPLTAHPPTLRGIDVATVLTMRDQARVAAVQMEYDLASNAIEELGSIKTIVIDPGHGGENQGAIGTAHVHEKFLTLDLAFALRDQLQEKYPTTRVILTRYWDKSMTLSERITLANEEGADLFLSLHYNAAVHSKAIGVETYFLTTEQAIPDGAPKKGEPLASVKPTTTGVDPGSLAVASSKGSEGASAKEPIDSQNKPGTYNDDLLTLQRDLARARQHERSGLFAEIVQEHLVANTNSLNRGVKQANFGVLRGALMPAVVVEAGFVTHPREGKDVLEEDHRQSVVDALMEAIIDFDEAVTEQNAR